METIKFRYIRKISTQKNYDAKPDYHKIAAYYSLEDLPCAVIPSSRLNKILTTLNSGASLSQWSLTYLQEQNFHALYRFATGELTYEAFLVLARKEQEHRAQALKMAAQALKAKQQALQEAKQAQLNARLKVEEEKREQHLRDPHYIAKQKNRALRVRYDLDVFIESEYFHRLMQILKNIDAGRRLKPEDFVWLSTEAEMYFSDKLYKAYHRIEADFFAAEFKKLRDLWLAVNASAHYRKACEPHIALALLKTIAIDRQLSSKLKAALYTTYGGVMRDLQDWYKAIELAEQAHTIRPTDYRPCTLLGAVHMEIGDYDLGQKWYKKAIERGASLEAVDQDLRKVFFAMNAEAQNKLRIFLLTEDPIRYAWAKKAKPKAGKNLYSGRKVPDL